MLLQSDLSHSIATTLRRTYGWLELGCPQEAAAQLEELPDILHSSREVLKIKCDILSASREWPELSALSSTSATYYPTEPSFAENWAWAEYKRGHTAEAYSILMTASANFQKTWRTNYFLACFAHALKRAQEAAEWLGHAFLLHSSPSQLKERALREELFRS